MVIPLPPQNAAKDLPEKYQSLLKKQKTENAPGKVEQNGKENSFISEEDKEAAALLLKEANGEVKENQSEAPLELPLILKYRNTNLDGIEDEEERYLQTNQSGKLIEFQS